jgi:hypothetical protein
MLATDKHSSLFARKVVSGEENVLQKGSGKPIRHLKTLMWNFINNLDRRSILGKMLNYDKVNLQLLAS